MKIVIALNELNVFGGTTTFALQLAQHLRSSGHEVKILGISSTVTAQIELKIVKTTMDMQQMSFVNISSLIKRGKVLKALEICVKYLYIQNIFRFKSLFDIKELNEADRIIALHSFVGFCVSKYFPSKTIIQFHTDFNTLIKNKKERRFINYFRDHVIYSGFISKTYELNAIEYGFEKTFFNYNFVNKVEKKTRYSKRVFFYGRLAKEKNLFLWLKIAKKIVEKDPGIYFEIYGDGILKDDIVLEISKLNLSNYVTLKGFKSNINEILMDGGIMLMTSDFEGTPMTIIECLFADIISASLDTFGAANELIKKDITGILEDPSQIEVLVEKIVNILNDDVMYDQYVFNAVELKKQFQTDVIIQKWNEIL